MSKTKTKYICQNCGYESINWMGKCNNCNSWNSFVEEQVITVKTKYIKASKKNQAVPINDVTVSKYKRLNTGIEEFDRVVGGGFVRGSVTLIGGDPGIGKSTISLQITNQIASSSNKVLYISGEESLEQIKMRGERLAALSENIYLLSETNIFEIEAVIKKTNPLLVIIDSIQTMYHPEIVSSPGSVSQVRESASYLIKYVKEKNISLVLVGHVTKEGSLAGPKVLEHIVDTVLYFEGERSQNFRILRCIKNRFGSTNEIGIFDMQAKGLIEIKNTSEIFVQDEYLKIPGSMIVAALEGTRSFLIEIQSLVSNSAFNMPRRTFTGIDTNRAAIIIAVLEKKCNFLLNQQDIFINVVGGVHVEETAADLGVALAIASSYKDSSINKKIAAIGEIGLGSEIRPVANIVKRINEAEKLGFTACIIPQGNLKIAREKFKKIELISVKTLSEAISKVF